MLINVTNSRLNLYILGSAVFNRTAPNLRRSSLRAAGEAIVSLNNAIIDFKRVAPYPSIRGTGVSDREAIDFNDRLDQGTRAPLSKRLNS